MEERRLTRRTLFAALAAVPGAAIAAPAVVAVAEPSSPALMVHVSEVAIWDEAKFREFLRLFEGMDYKEFEW